MSHQVETMAFANATPWHGLGNRVDPTVSIEEMTRAAGLDWEVQPYRLFAEIDGHRVNVDRAAFVRSSDRKVLTIASESWKPFQNRDAMEFFRDFTETGNITLETAGSLRGGRIVWGLAALHHSYEVTEGDKVAGYLLLISPHEVGKSNSVRVTSVRVVCANTMAMALAAGSAHYSQTHASEFKADRAKEVVAAAIDQFMGNEKTSKKLAALKMSREDTIRVLAPHFQPDTEIEDLLKKDALNRRFEQVLESVNTAPGALPNNAWGVLNGVTHWADHVAGRNADTRLTRAWLGRTGRIKQRVMTDLLRRAS